MSQDIQERLQQLKDRFLERDFRLNKTQVDVPYYVFPYDPKDELEVREFVSKLDSDTERPYELLVFNLYEMLIDYLKKRHFLEKSQQFEEEGGIPQVVMRLGRLLKMDDSNNVLTSMILKKVAFESDQIILLTGIGEAFPLIRSHNVMNTLSNQLQDKPVVLMFPGEFENGYLKTFNQLKDENYYRAIRLF